MFWAYSYLITILYEYIHQLINAPTSTNTHFPSLVLTFLHLYSLSFLLTSLHLYSLTFTLVPYMWASMTFLPLHVLALCYAYYFHSPLLMNAIFGSTNLLYGSCIQLSNRSDGTNRQLPCEHDSR